MLVAMTAMFFTVSDIPNILSVLAIIVLFFGTVLFVVKNMTVFWIHGEEFLFRSAVHNVQPRIPQMKMMKVHIPFTFKLVETSKSSFEELRCVVSSQACYRLEAYWGVGIRELHMFLWSSWNSIQSAAKEGTLLNGHYQYSGLHLREECHGDKTFVLSLSDDCLNLGAPPRLSYPLVIFLIRDTASSLQPDETVALINVIHIKDTVCTLPTSILAQYLKQANGQLSCLKQLYLASGNPLSYETGFEKVEQLCVVCQFFPLSRALLPCRHTCICASCFGKLETCPMCRSPIKSYFCIRGEEYIADCDKANCSPPKPVHISQWFQDRITDFLGFQR